MLLGGTTHVLSLPMAWVKEQGLKKGSEVEISTAGKNLLIHSEEIKKKSKITLTVKKGELFLRRYLTMLYIMGYDEIEIRFEEKAHIARLKDRLYELLGFELVEQSDHHYVIKNVASTIEDEMPVMLKRTFFMVGQIAKDIGEAYQKKDLDKLQECADMEPLVDRITNFCKRAINKEGESERSKATYLFMIIENLEKISDYYARLCTYLVHQKISPSLSIKKLMDKLASLFSDLMHLFYNFDRKKLPEFKKKRVALAQDIEKSFTSSTGAQARILSSLSAVLETEMDIELMLVFL